MELNRGVIDDTHSNIRNTNQPMQALAHIEKVEGLSVLASAEGVVKLPSIGNIVVEPC
ncbi:hypothetical protein [Shouchella patagoniensis]|uniref:hypothetical protein n=1 Tax=Shouchella patagoniensis TaxID=228576 RepID=UPI001C591865|nr:hypothetical protein [Shouchella patagoniensis]